MSWGNEARRGPLLLVLGGVLAACAAFTGWAWLQFQQASEQARALAAAAAEISEQVSADNWSAVQAAVPVAVLQADDLLQTTDTPTWRLISALPVIGGRAEALRGAAQALSPVLRAATSVNESSVEVRHAWDSGAEIDPATADAFARQVSRLGGAVRLARAHVITVSQQGVPPDAAASLAEVSAGLDDLDQRLTTLEASMRMLGWGQPYRWLVVLLDPTRIRGSGGAVQAMAVVTLDGGRITEVQPGPQPGSGRITAVSHPLDLAWQGRLTNWTGMSSHPDFAVTASIAAAASTTIGAPVDGVLAVDSTALRDLAGVTASDSAALAQDLRGMDYLRGDAMTTHVMLQQAYRGEIQGWSDDPAEAAVLENESFLTHLKDASQESIAVSINDTSPFGRANVRGSIRYQVGQCSTGPRGDLRMAITLENADSSQVELLLHIIGPVGSKLSRVTSDGEAVGVASHQEGMRPVWWLLTTVGAHQRRTVVFEVTSPARGTLVTPRVLAGPAQRFHVDVQTKSNCVTG